MKTLNEVEIDSNADPLSGEHGSHPVGTGVGAASGAAAGAAVGAVVGGPLGAIVGGAIGAVTGGAAGHAVGEAVNPTVESVYWEGQYRSQPYFEAGRPYGDYEPAYRYGWEARGARPGARWEEAQNDLAAGWEKAKGKSTLAWDQASAATRDAWHRIERRLPGDADGDGR
ncbi:MAG: hypothetical protein ABIV06_05970 [Thermoanaerobaculia bacterium]